jgi:F0F1-type ATP synthase membrane subunit c/vacuolar-type H+-ATPase subunit K
MGRALLFVAMGEGIGVLGLVGGILMMRYLAL